MNVVTVLVLVAVIAVVGLLIAAPSAPVRRNPFPGRDRRAGLRRYRRADSAR
ncbi:hypothetical protein [Streptomyces sp. NRRL F-2664]|uniref:hypothetical protein n=1 Tax=Streptomyces sp. NRRL F-2664 TaxID=1463842 RepID=UPI0018FE788F|nr:hypothetical protein [Streptomyces sp. NRRL F-2664]